VTFGEGGVEDIYGMPQPTVITLFSLGDSKFTHPIPALCDSHRKRCQARPGVRYSILSCKMANLLPSKLKYDAGHDECRQLPRWFPSRFLSSIHGTSYI
jgi:hypothetical protein